MTSLVVQSRPSSSLVVQSRTGGRLILNTPGIPGPPAPALQVQYSIDGSSWSTSYISNAMYIRFSLDGGSTYSVGPLRLMGDIGVDGLSAYEVAVENSFVGTESDWLASLKGDPGAGLTILGTLASTDDLPADPDVGDGYIIGGDLYTYTPTGWVVVYSAPPFVPPVRLQQDVTTYTLSEESASRRIIFTSPNPCTVTLPDTGLPIGFHCLIRNSGGGSLTVVPTGDAVIENTILKWSDPTKYGSVLLESTSPFYTYFLMGGLEE